MAELPENDRIAGPFIATGGQTDFPADFPLIDASALRFRRERGGVVTVLSGADVSAVTIVADGFTCRLTTPSQAGDRCFVYSALPPRRLRQHTPNGATRTTTLEGDAVEAQAQLQEHRRDLVRAISAPFGETGPELPPQAVRDGGVAVFTGAAIDGVKIAPGQVLGADPATGAIVSMPQTVTVALETAVISSRQAAQAASWGDNVGFIQTQGHLSAGDHGRALWARAMAEPGHPGKFQSADGKWWELAETRVNVHVFGARGNGDAAVGSGTDDTTAFAQALAFIAARGGGVLTALPRRYRLTAALDQVFPDKVPVVVDLDGAVLDAREITGVDTGDTRILRLRGSRISSSALGANAAKHAFGLTAANAGWAGTLTADDIVLVTSTDLFNPTRANYVKGELVSVDGVAGAALTLGVRLYDSYASATTTLHRLAMPEIEVRNLKILGNANQLGLCVEYARNVAIERVRARGTRYAGILTDFCYGGSVSKCQVSDVWYEGTGTSYGVVVGCCQNFTVDKCQLEGARHCITLGGAEPARAVTISGNHCLSKPTQEGLVSIDSHENVEGLNILGNTCNGISVGGLDINIVGNTVRGYAGAGGGINAMYTDDAGFLNIASNTVRIDGNDGMGVWITLQRNIPGSPETLTLADLSIKDNQIHTRGRCIVIEPRNAGSTNVRVDELTIVDNGLYSETSLCVAISVGLPMAFGSVDISDNRMRSALWDVLYMEDAVTTVVTKLHGNVVRGARPGGYLLHLSGGDVTLLGNDIRGLPGDDASRSILYACDGVITVRDNTILNTVFSAEITDGDVYYSSDNRCSTYGLLNAGGAALLGSISESGNNLLQRSSAPSAGELKVGDVVFTTDPANGGKVGWSRTDAGAVKPFGAIDA